MPTNKLLFRSGDAWSESAMYDCLEACQEIAANDLGLDIFPNRLMVVSETGMLDAYAANGMPAMYPHWSFGLRRKEQERGLREGNMGLAYELVVPTNPCISWNLSSNSAAMMLTVIAHAAIGHNHVFKRNHVFERHTQHNSLGSYCQYARRFVLECEKKYGAEEVEYILDAAHSLSLPGGIFRHTEPPEYDLEQEQKNLADRMRAYEENLDPDMLASVSGLREKFLKRPELRENKPLLPQENILWFIERYSPRLKPWQRELIRIVRNLAQQTTYPYVQTKVLNEGAAMFVENYIVRTLYKEGRIDDGTLLEFFETNQAVLYQPEMRRTKQLNARHNPYALGFRIMKEIVRVAGVSGEEAEFFKDWGIDTTGPTAEDYRLFRRYAGKGEWRDVLKHAWADFRDDTLIEQFLTPEAVRQLGLFVIEDEGKQYRVTEIHDELGFELVRTHLARSHCFDSMFPDIRITDVDLLDDRTLTLSYFPRESMRLHQDDAELTREFAEELWGYDVVLHDPARE